ncbi:MAG: diaminopimelate decarboxylase [Pseudomonadales bacterium]
MEPFNRVAGVLHAEAVPLSEIAERFGTPVYVYSKRYFQDRYWRLAEAMAPLGADICYAVKANSNLSVLRCFHDLGAGFDIVSGGELQRVLSAGGDPARVVFSGVGKREDEIDFALKQSIRCFNVESAAELARIASRARVHGCVAPISVRVNPHVDARTHPYISTGLKTSKFGVPVTQARDLYRQASQDAALRVVGIDCHIGSQIATAEPLLEALASLLSLVDDLGRDGIHLEHVDVGGGLGVTYRDEPDFDVTAYGAALNRAMAGRKERLVLEPGRYLVANGGVLLTRVEYLKPAAEAEATSFAVVDAAMNDLIRPALYQAWHDVVPVGGEAAGAQRQRWNLVGPVCESGDFIAADRDLMLAEGDLLAVLSAGAYGMAQSSNYNTRGRAAEVLVAGDHVRLIRRRETVRDQLALELAEDQPFTLGCASGATS